MYKVIVKAFGGSDRLQVVEMPDEVMEQGQHIGKLILVA